MAQQRLTKSGDQVIDGVAGGIANYFGIDPVLVRLVFLALLVLEGGAMVLLYIVLAVIMPEPGEVDETASAGRGGERLREAGQELGEELREAGQRIESQLQQAGQSLRAGEGTSRRARWVGIGLIALGLLFFADDLNLFTVNFDAELLLPLLFVLIGARILISGVREEGS